MTEKTLNEEMQSTLTFHERDLTEDEIAARGKVWDASQKGEGVALSSHEAYVLWQSILQTGRELTVLRDIAREEGYRVSR